MEEKTFQERARAAKIFKETDHENADFWSGYERGLRRLYHGERFGTPDEHVLWMSLIDDQDEARKMRGLGYRYGFAGHDITTAIKMLKERGKA